MKRTAAEIRLRSGLAWNAKVQASPYLADAWTLSLPGNDASNPYRGRGDTPFAGSNLGFAAESAGVQNDFVVVLDGTLATSLSRLINRIMQELFATGSKWASLRARPTVEDGVEVEPDEALQEALDAGNELAFTGIHGSNFDVEMHSALTDCGISGLGVLRVHYSQETDGPPLEFEAMCSAVIAIEYGPTRKVEAIYRQVGMLSAEHIRTLWPNATDVLDETGMEPEEKAQPRKYHVEDCAYWDRSARKWRYVVLQMASPDGKGTSRDGEIRQVFEDEAELCPFVVFFYDRITGSVALRSPVLRALPFARVLNELAFHTLEATAYAASGLYLVEHGAVVNSAKNVVQPGGIIHLRRGALARAGGAAFQSLPVSSRMDIAHMKREELVMHVKEAMMDEALPQDTGAPKSATEIAARLKELRANLGAFYSRLVRSVGVPVIQHVLYALERRGELEGIGIDESITEIVRDGKRAEIVFSNPLIRSQNLTDAQNILQGAEAVSMTFGRETLPLVMDVPKAARAVLDKMEVPAELMLAEQRADALFQTYQQQIAAGETGSQPAPAGAPAGAGGLMG